MFTVHSSQFTEKANKAERPTTVNREPRTDNHGFTLIELILYVAIVAIFLTAAIQYSWGVIYGRVKYNVQQEVNQNLRFTTARISYELRRAQAINSLSASSVSLAMSESARNPTVIDLSGGRVRIGYGSSGSCPTTSPCFLTSSDVTATSLTFTNLSSTGNNSIHVRFNLTLQNINTSGRSEFDKTQTYTSSAELRSH